MPSPLSASTAGTPPVPSRDAAYPDILKTAELAALQLRRRILDPHLPADPPKAFPPDTAGFALSGGGIRSATFCLGVFQGLARLHLLKRIDYLSTVSGGGYFGGFYGAWLNRGNGKAPTAGWLKSTLLFWRRDWRKSEPAKGNFAEVERKLVDPDAFPVSWLRQNGRYLTPNGGGDAMLAAAAALRNWLSIHFVLAVFLVTVFGGITVLTRFLPGLPVAATDWCGRPETAPVHWSPWFWTVLVPLGFGLVIGTLYWIPGLAGEVRNRYTRWLAGTLVAVLGLGGLAVLDTVGATLWDNRHALKLACCTWIWEGGGLAAVLLALARKGTSLLSRLSTQKQKLSVPLGYVVMAGAFILAALWLAALDTGAHALVERWPRGLLLFAATALVGGLQLGFLNLSSQANLYGSRLTRTYLGASNPDRDQPHAQQITETISGDIVPFETYEPEKAGGPLHLINITVNETMDGRSRTEELDRKGFNLALGPAGLSAAVRHHALWEAEGDRPRGAIRPIDNGGFHCLGDVTLRAHPVEQKELGQWIGISGAAFSTGLGARTNPGLSFLCGFFNVRLGWWWNSGVSPARRHEGFWARLRSLLGRLPSTFFPMQAQLLNEFRARFYGSARRHWYLSDGGHFENTAAYELVRRRLPFIAICDDGCDPGRQLEDFANLVRKARIDFNAEIEVLPGDAIPGMLAKHIAGSEEISSDPARPSFPTKPALLARVRYLDGQDPDSLLLLLKPTVTGDEPADVLNYRAQNPSFPQETTMDQFFDEAQWESYRKLGETTALKLFTHVRDQSFAVAFATAGPDGPARV